MICMVVQLSELLHFPIAGSFPSKSAALDGLFDQPSAPINVPNYSAPANSIGWSWML